MGGYLPEALRPLTPSDLRVLVGFTRLDRFLDILKRTRELIRIEQVAPALA